MQDRYEDVCLFEGTASDYAYDLIEETTEIPEIFEINHDLIVTNAQEF